MSTVRFRSCAFVAILLVSACDKKKDEAAEKGAEPPTTATPAAPAAATGDQIAFASGAMFFKSADGTVKSWGVGSLVGDAPAEPRLKPGAVADLANTKRLAVGGGQTMCAAMNDGSVKCWGNGASGELGDGKENEIDKPVVVPDVTNATAVAIGTYHVCALIGDGTVKCWGNNGFQQASVEKKEKFVTPTAVPGITDAVLITAGGDTSCALGKDGSVKCWGFRCSFDQATDCSKPATIAALAGATDIAAGWQSLCAVDKDAAVQCWGKNDEGQLGSGNTDSIDALSPVKGVSGATAVAAGQMHWCALIKDGTVQCWGSNEYGQLGDGTLPEADKNEFRATAAPVKGVADAVALSCGSGTCCAQIKDKSVKCWGENSSFFGEANEETSNVATPIVVTVQ